jgi:hypothetical protein
MARENPVAVAVRERAEGERLDRKEKAERRRQRQATADELEVAYQAARRAYLARVHTIGLTGSPTDVPSPSDRAAVEGDPEANRLRLEAARAWDRFASHVWPVSSGATTGTPAGGGFEE